MADTINNILQHNKIESNNGIYSIYENIDDIKIEQNIYQRIISIWKVMIKEMSFYMSLQSGLFELCK